MDKKVYLLDYKGKQYEYTIKDFEKVEYAYIEIMSGDWVLTVEKDSGKEIFDTSEHHCGRYINFYDGRYEINPNRIDELKDFTNPYALTDML